MNTRVFVASALALAVLAPAAANALTIDNKDKSAYTLKFMPKGGKETSLSLKANSTTDVDCKAGGTLSLGKATQACDAKTAKITVKGGKFVM